MCNWFLFLVFISGLRTLCLFFVPFAPFALSLPLLARGVQLEYREVKPLGQAKVLVLLAVAAGTWWKKINPQNYELPFHGRANHILSVIDYGWWKSGFAACLILPMHVGGNCLPSSPGACRSGRAALSAHLSVYEELISWGVGRGHDRNTCWFWSCLVNRLSAWEASKFQKPSIHLSRSGNIRVTWTVTLWTIPQHVRSETGTAPKCLVI